MPNHCENDLYIRGPNVESVLEFIGASRTPPEFDFNTLIPYPDRFAAMDAEQRDIASAGKAAGLAAIGGAFPEWGSPEWDVMIGTYHLAEHEVTRPLMDAYEAKWGTRSDGFNSGGYEWCCNNWETKWGAYDVARRDYDGCAIVTYQTAWSPSKVIIRALARRFPDHTFTLEYFERGMGFCGGITCPSQDDYYGDKPWRPGIISNEWECKGYRGRRGG